MGLYVTETIESAYPGGDPHSPDRRLAGSATGPGAVRRCGEPV